MARNADLISARNKKIKEDFKALSEKKSEGGKAIYKFQYILELLAKKYFLEEITIQRILTEPEVKEDTTQIEIDF